MAGSLAYAGDVSPAKAYEALASAPEAMLVDVRSRPEWTFVGLPDLAAIGKEPLLAEWQSYPAMGVSDAFVPMLTREVERRGGDAGTPLYFICRSGARSQAAAMAMTAAGFTHCYNVAGGFEGRLDGTQHRGTLEGWKATGLPWVQS
jgi:rhodanese-related sulfurtransferase